MQYFQYKIYPVAFTLLLGMNGLHAGIVEDTITKTAEIIVDTTEGAVEVFRNAGKEKSKPEDNQLPPTKSSPELSIGDVVETTEILNVRTTPTGALAGTQEPNTKGIIIGGPVPFGGHTYWEVDYDGESDGWSVDSSLIRVVQKLPATIPNTSEPDTAGTGTKID